MEATEFLRKLKEQRQNNLFFIYGAEEYLVDTVAKQLAAALKVEHYELNFSSFREKADFQQISVCAASCPVLPSIEWCSWRIWIYLKRTARCLNSWKNCRNTQS